MLHTHFTYMIHSVRKFLWKGIGKSCFHCLRETKHHYTAEETQFETTFKFRNVYYSTWWLTHRCCCGDQPGIGHYSKFLKGQKCLSSDQKDTAHIQQTKVELLLDLDEEHGSVSPSVKATSPPQKSAFSKDVK